MSKPGAGKATLTLPAELRDLPRPTLVALGTVAVNLLLLLVVVPYAMGQLDDLQVQFNRLRGEVTQTRTLTLQARKDFEFVQENSARYVDALDRGLFEAQDRLDATARLDELYNRDHLAALAYEFTSQTTAEGRGITIVTTPLRLSADAMLDRDIYMFMRDLQHSFPGVLVLREMRIRPKVPLSGQVLDSIRAGTAVALFNADLSYDWRVAREEAAK